MADPEFAFVMKDNAPVVNTQWAVNDSISRAYAPHSKKRFVEWFDTKLGVAECALCDEVFLHDTPDFAHVIDKLDALDVGEACVVLEDACIIMRVK